MSEATSVFSLFPHITALMRATCYLRSWRMDWKAFIAAMVGSLAWPIVVFTLLIFLRKQLVGLAERLQELSLGGAKATFEKQLETARREADKLPPPLSVPEIPDDQRLVPIPMMQSSYDWLRNFQKPQSQRSTKVLKRFSSRSAIILTFGKQMQIALWTSW
jgi:hypothetical protein